MFLQLLPLIIVLALLSRDFARGRLGILRPNLYFLLGCAAFLGFPALNIEVEKDPVAFQVLVWVSIGLVAFGLGESLYRPRQHRQQTEATPVRPVQFKTKRAYVVITVYTIAAGVLLSTIAGWYGKSATELLLAQRTVSMEYSLIPEFVRNYAVALLRLAAAAGMLGMLLFAYARPRSIDKPAGLLAALLQAPYAFFGGSRFSLVQYFVALFCVWYVTARSAMTKKLKAMTLAAVVGCIVIVGVGFLAANREVGITSESTVDLRPEIVVRSFGFDTLTSTVEAFYQFPSRHEYLFGLSYLALPVSPIPRAWWPGKPVALGAIMSDLTSASASLAVSTVGELYVNFGYAGIPIGMALYGFLCEVLYATFLRRGHDVRFSLPYACALPFITMHVRGEFFTVWVHYLTIGIPLYVAVRFLCKRKRSVVYARQGVANRPQFMNFPRPIGVTGQGRFAKTPDLRSAPRRM